MEKYEQQISVINSRILIPMKVNDKVEYFLADTGAHVSLIDSNKAKKLKFKLQAKMAGQITGVGGEGGEIWRCKNLEVEFDGIKLYQFLATDLSSIVDSIKRDTDYEIVGVLSLPQMQQLGWIIDTKAGKIYYQKD